MKACSSIQGIRRKITGCKPADLTDTGDPMEHRRQKKFLDVHIFDFCPFQFELKKAFYSKLYHKLV